LNDSICSILSTLLQKPIHRVKEAQFCSAKGAAFAAGINAGLWTEDFISTCVRLEKSFHPVLSDKALMDRFRHWKFSNKYFDTFGHPLTPKTS